MQSKQLITALCALGILGSGACFLPPTESKAPPPPPLRVDLHGSKRIFVQVADSSPAQHIDAKFAAAQIAELLAEKTHVSNISVVSEGARQPDDALLLVSILSESAAELPAKKPGTREWKIAVTLDASLTAGDGSLVWRRSGLEYAAEFTDWHPGAEEPGIEAAFKGRGFFLIFRPFVTQMWNALH